MPTSTRTDKSASAIPDERIREYLPLVHYAVNEISARIPRHVRRDDLVSAGLLGLAQAARSFDPERGIAFSRYASRRIRGAILDELRSRDWASRSVRAKARRIRDTADQLTGQLGRVPTDGEVATALGDRSDCVSAVAADVHRAVVLTLDSLPGDHDREPVDGDASPEERILAHERKAYMIAAVANLPERLRRVVVGYYLEERPMHELALELGVTDSRISQMRSEALELLRDGINSQLDPELVDVVDAGARRAARKRAYHEAIAATSQPRLRLEPESASLASLRTLTCA